MSINSSKTFEKSMEELGKIVNTLESNTLSLDESITLYNRGQKLYKHCQSIIESLTLKIENIQ